MNPPKDGNPNPFGNWEKIKTSDLRKKYGAKNKALAFCPPQPEDILIKAFKEIEKAKATATAYKAAMDTMADVGASTNAFLLAAEPIIKLKLELKQFLQVWDEQHMYPWNEGFPFDQWARDLDKLQPSTTRSKRCAGWWLITLAANSFLLIWPT